MISPQQQTDFVEYVLKKWIPIADNMLKQAISKRERHIPTGTAEAIKHDLFKEAGALLNGYALSFPEEGRFVDMRKLEYKNRPIARGNNFILKWVKKRGLSKFKKIPGYKNKKDARRLSEDQKLERIASAIIASYDSDITSRKRRGAWYNRTIYKALSILQDMLYKEQAEFFADHLQDQYKKALSS